MSYTTRAWRPRLPALIAAACVVAVLCGGGTPAGAAPPVYVFPIPGASFASPSTQITFRGLNAGGLGHIGVKGSVTGSHSGSLEPHSDGLGASFVPNKGFAPGESVTVTTGLNIVGGNHGTYAFRVASPAPPNHGRPFPPSGRTRFDVPHFKTRHDLFPASVQILRQSSRTARGDVFVAPQTGPLQDGPMILDWRGNLLWFKALPGRQFASDFRVQRYHGQSVLTWWQGLVSVGIGDGVDVINDGSYHQIQVVRAGNGLTADLHEFQLTRHGTALITAYYPVYHDSRSVGGSYKQIVEDSVVQEIDIPTGLVVFQWDSLDHVPLVGSHGPLKVPYNPFHVNSVDEDYDGNLVISGRNMWSVYKVNRLTAATIWVLGGRYSTFKMGSGAQFAYQHDVRVHGRGDRTITVYDDGGSPFVHNSRGVTLHLDFRHKTATRVGQDSHSPSLQAQFEGNMQQLSNGDAFIGWGQPPYWSEFNSSGQMIYDARFVDDNSSYRAWRMRWNGNPQTAPAVATRTSGNTTTVWASWNGATNVSSWRVLGGGSPGSLHVVGGASKAGFETEMNVGAQRYVAVEAVDSRHHVLRRSAVVRG